MGKFSTPQWDSNTVADEICNTLFKGKGKGKAKSKEKLKNGGKIVKAKLKKAKEQINKKFVKNIQEKLDFNVKNLVDKAKKNTNKQNQQKTEHDSSSTSNGNEINTSQKKLNKKRKKQKLKNLPNFKYVKNMVKTQLSNGDDDQRFLISEDGDQRITERSTPKPKLKNKGKKMELQNLQKDMTKQINSDILEVKSKLKKKKKKPQWKVFDDGIDTGNCSLNITQDSRDNTTVTESDKKSKKNSSLRERMLAKLKSSRFRYLNEQLYCSGSKDAQTLFKSDPDSFKAYHEGFRQQVERWPVNPVDIVIKSIKKMNKTHVIADFGCGDAKIAQEVKQKVHSFDLAATNERVTACDMANVPLANESVDIAVFCLSLMGTNLLDYLKEANRVLKIGGILKIAEVESRFNDVEEFIKGVKCYGFQNIHKDLTHNLFYFLDFKKTTDTKKGKGLPTLSLNPCLYKKR